MKARVRMKPLKRYCVIFSLWGSRNVDDVTFFDSREELKEETKLLRKYYQDTKKPKMIGKAPNYSEGGCFWGYVSLDYEKAQVLEIYGDGVRIYTKKDTIIQETRINYLKDLLFRGENEIPKGYKWDDGEYDGWIRFRWGDGGNAIKPKAPKGHGLNLRAVNDYEPDPQEKYDKEIEREWKERKLDRW